jgi:alpha-L-rhamnosidase
MRIVLLLLIYFFGGVFADLLPTSLRVNNLVNPLAVLVRSVGNVTTSPLFFSWSLNITSGSTRAIQQVAWRLQIYRDDQETLICDENSTSLNYALQSVYACSNELSQLSGGTRLVWQVSVLGSDSSTSWNWSQEKATFGISPDPTQWNQTPWISSPITTSRPYRFRTIVTIPSTPIQINAVTLYIATPCYYIISSNGSKLTSRFPISTFTLFSSRVDYDAFDVTSSFIQALTDGTNQIAFGIKLGGGAFGTEKFRKVNNAMHLPLRVIVILDSKQDNTTDNTTVLAPIVWKSYPDSILYSDWYAGESIDNRLESNFIGWDSLQFNDTLWIPSTPCEGNCGIENAQLVPQLQPPVKLMKDGILTPIAIYSLSTPQSFTISFDQNFAGYVEIDIPSPPSSIGTTVSFYAGERLFSDNAVYNQLNSSTLMILNWTLSCESPIETVGNVFSFWGFQHVQVNNWPLGVTPPTLQSVRGFPTSTLEQRATIEFDGIKPSANIASTFVNEKRRIDSSSSDTLVPNTTFLILNSSILAGIVHAAYWSQASNYQSIPSDCPNREKRGWMGDAAVSSSSASLVFDMATPYYSWTRSHGDDQVFNGYSGVVNNIVPAEVNSPPAIIDAAWGLAIIEVVYQSVIHFSEVRTLKERYKDMKLYVDWLTSKTNKTVGIMKDEYEFGDWDAQFPRSQYVNNTAPMGATGSWLRCLQLMEKLAPIAGYPDDAIQFRQIFNNSIIPFNDYYALNLTNGTYGDGQEQTLAIIPLILDIVPRQSLINVQNWLIYDIETTQSLHLTTGATGTRFFFETLTKMGRVDLAAVISAQTTMPSHGYWITQGATTCWENWSGEADLPHPPPPTHNHIFLCSQIGWIYNVLLGLSVSSPYVCRITPPLIDSLPRMSGAIYTPGSQTTKVSTSWAWMGPPMASTFQLNVSLPANMNATISFPIPGLTNPIISEDDIIIWQNGTFIPTNGIYSGKLVDGSIEFSIGSGNFIFSSEKTITNPVIISSCVRAVEFNNARQSLDLICPLQSGYISHITRAGIVTNQETALEFIKPTVTQLQSLISHRFLLTHMIERVCLGRASRICTLSIDSLYEIESRIKKTGMKNNIDEFICVVASCN